MNPTTGFECHWDEGYCCDPDHIATDFHTPAHMKLYWKTIGPFISGVWYFGAGRRWWN